jgi:hypothetical protein
MTPKTDTESRYAGLSGAGVTGSREQAPEAVTGRGSTRATVAWSHVLPLAVVLAFANGFWLVVFRGAVGAIERTSAPFSTWLHESTLLLPVYVVAVLVAFVLAQRWFGSRPRGVRATGASLGLVAGFATLAGTLLLIASSWFDFRLQVDDLHHTGQMHMSCDSVCVSDRISATLNLEIKAAWIGLLLMLVTDLVLIGLVVAFRGGVLVLGRAPRTENPRSFDGWRLVLAAGLLGAAVVEAALVPSRLGDWWLAGTVYAVLALLGVAATAAVLAGDRLRSSALVAAATLSGVSVLGYVATRVAGPSFGPADFGSEWVGVAAVMTVALQVATLAIALVLLRRRTQGRPWTPYGVAIGLCAVVALTVIGVGGADLPGVGAFSTLGEHHTHGGFITQG